MEELADAPLRDKTDGRMARCRVAGIALGKQVEWEDLKQHQRNMYILPHQIAPICSR